MALGPIVAWNSWHGGGFMLTSGDAGALVAVTPIISMNPPHPADPCCTRKNRPEVPTRKTLR